MADEIFLDDTINKARKEWIQHGQGHFHDWLEKNFNCVVYVDPNSFSPRLEFITPAAKTFFILRWS